MASFMCTVDLRNPLFDGTEGHKQELLIALLEDMIGRMKRGHTVGGFASTDHGDFDGGFVVGNVDNEDVAPVREHNKIVEIVANGDEMLKTETLREKYAIRWMTEAQMQDSLKEWAAVKARVRR